MDRLKDVVEGDGGFSCSFQRIYDGGVSAKLGWWGFGGIGVTLSPGIPFAGPEQKEDFKRIGGDSPGILLREEGWNSVISRNLNLLLREEEESRVNPG